MLSHLLQMRGLKRLIGLIPKAILVASFTDAWIETVITSKFNEYASVASFTDAWIETSYNFLLWLVFESHLLQMRGLKLNNDY